MIKKKITSKTTASNKVSEAIPNNEVSSTLDVKICQKLEPCTLVFGHEDMNKLVEYINKIVEKINKC